VGIPKEVSQLSAEGCYPRETLKNLITSKAIIIKIIYTFKLIAMDLDV